MPQNVDMVKGPRIQYMEFNTVTELAENIVCYSR